MYKYQGTKFHELLDTYFYLIIFYYSCIIRKSIIIIIIILNTIFLFVYLTPNCFIIYIGRCLQ